MITKFADVKNGDLMAVLMYARVTGTHQNHISCENVDNGQLFDVNGQSLVEEMFSADQFQEIRKVTKTEMAETLSNSFNVPFTVVFQKQDGSQRKLRGRLIEPERLMGRCRVQDLDERGSTRLRLVDNRTLTELIVKGVKYVLK